MTNWRAVRWTVGSIAAVALLLVGGGVAYFFVFSADPTYHDNPSFKYGENVMETRIYGQCCLTPGKSVKQRCQNELAWDVSPPANLDVGEAVKGCVYLEYLYDN